MTLLGASTDVTVTRLRRAALAGGIASPLLYVGTDLLAGALYPGYSFASQAVSELFAIGAPTSRLVVPLFTLASALLLAFALGVWLAAGPRRARRVMAVMIAGNAINCLVLWTLFPMHMRGVPTTLTDTMHGLLAINPFVLATICLGVAAFKGWLRLYSITTIVVLIVPALVAVPDAQAYLANQPTPWLGLAERVSQYGHLLWHAVLAGVLLRAQSVELPLRGGVR
jgi:hypothetical protein